MKGIGTLTACLITATSLVLARNAEAQVGRIILVMTMTLAVAADGLRSLRETTATSNTNSPMAIDKEGEKS